MNAVCEHGQLGRVCNVCELIAERDHWKAKAERLAEALRQCSKPSGAFSVDHLEHAKNCIAEVIRISEEALSEFEGKVMK